MANEIVLQPFSGDTLAITTVAASVTWAPTQYALQGSAAYTIDGSALGLKNALAGTAFVVTGCTHPSNNGTFLCLSSSSTGGNTILNLNNAYAVVESPTAAFAAYSTQGFPI